jgi:tRNA(Ile)-lysidine synthase
MQINIAALPDQFTAYLAQLGPFENAPHLAIAVSGGADSMALCLLAHETISAQNGRITALHIDHQLRAESGDEAAQVAQWLAARHIACEVIRVDIAQNKNLQAAAREARFLALTRYCKQHDLLHLLLGHHAGDQAETVALHMQRGNTTDGPAGMSASMMRDGVRILRPLLSLQKPALEVYLRSKQQAWIEDPSNQNTRFKRVRIRAELTENPNQQEALLTIAAQAGSARMAREKQLMQDAASCVQLYPQAYGRLHMSIFLNLPPARARLLLANLLRCLSGKATRPRMHETARLYAGLCDRAVPFAKSTLGGLVLNWQSEHLLLTRETARMPVITLKNNAGSIRYDQRFTIGWQGLNAAEYQLKPLGLQGISQLKQADQMPNHLPKAALLSLPSLWHLDTLQAVPYIDYADKSLPKTVQLHTSFRPAKALAASDFCCLHPN